MNVEWFASHMTQHWQRERGVSVHPGAGGRAGGPRPLCEGCLKVENISRQMWQLVMVTFQGSRDDF